MGHFFEEHEKLSSVKTCNEVTCNFHQCSFVQGASHNHWNKVCDVLGVNGAVFHVVHQLLCRDLEQKQEQNVFSVSKAVRVS